MPEKTKPDLSEHEEEFVPLDDVLRQLLKAKPKTAEQTAPSKQSGAESESEGKSR